MNMAAYSCTAPRAVSISFSSGVSSFFKFLRRVAAMKTDVIVTTPIGRVSRSAITETDLAWARTARWHGYWLMELAARRVRPMEMSSPSKKMHSTMRTYGVPRVLHPSAKTATRLSCNHLTRVSSASEPNSAKISASVRVWLPCPNCLSSRVAQSTYARKAAKRH
jgi:hypothetical protein